MFSYLSESSISSATVTPSLVMLGAPHPLSITALRPRGPRVAFTARASFVTPSSSALRASASKASILAAMPHLLLNELIVASDQLPVQIQPWPGRWTGRCHAKPDADAKDRRGRPRTNAMPGASGDFSPT